MKGTDCPDDLRGPEICKQDAYSLQGSRAQHGGECGGLARKIMFMMKPIVERVYVTARGLALL